MDHVSNLSLSPPASTVSSSAQNTGSQSSAVKQQSGEQANKETNKDKELESSTFSPPPTSSSSSSSASSDVSMMTETKTNEETNKQQVLSDDDATNINKPASNSTSLEEKTSDNCNNSRVADEANSVEAKSEAKLDEIKVIEKPEEDEDDVEAMMDELIQARLGADMDYYEDNFEEDEFDEEFDEEYFEDYFDQYNKSKGVANAGKTNGHSAAAIKHRLRRLRRTHRQQATAPVSSATTSFNLIGVDKLEIFGSIHVRASNVRLLSCLIDQQLQLSIDNESSTSFSSASSSISSSINHNHASKNNANAATVNDDSLMLGATVGCRSSAKQHLMFQKRRLRMLNDEIDIIDFEQQNPDLIMKRQQRLSPLKRKGDRMSSYRPECGEFASSRSNYNVVDRHYQQQESRVHGHHQSSHQHSRHCYKRHYCVRNRVKRGQQQVRILSI